MLRNKEKLVEMGLISFLRKVSSNSEASRPKCSETEDCLDGGPGATEDRLPLSVIQVHKGFLGNKQEKKTVN